MTSSFPSFRTFLRALRQGDATARRVLTDVFLQPISGLVRLHTRRYRPTHDPESFVYGILAWLEMVFVSLSEVKVLELEEIAVRFGKKVAGTSERRLSGRAPWESVIQRFGLLAAKQHCLLAPAKLPRESELRLTELTGVGPQLPGEGSRAFDVSGALLNARWLVVPLEAVSGDVADMAESHGALWVMVGDAQGHGWLANAVIDGLRHLWKALLAQSHARIDPRGLLQELDQRLRDCLPDWMFVEATLARFPSDPSFTVAVAGNVRLIVRRRSDRQAEMHHLGTCYLGPIGDAPETQESFDFEKGDEVAFFSDGLIDHPYKDRNLGDMLLEHVHSNTAENSLYQLLATALKDAGSHGKARDDVTVLTVRRVSEK